MSLRKIIELITQIGFFGIGTLFSRSDSKLRRTIGTILQVVSTLGFVFFLVLWSIQDRS